MILVPLINNAPGKYRWVFVHGNNTGGTSHQSFDIPPGCIMLSWILIGAGAGGGGGRTAAAGNNKGGGGGGGCGGISTGQIPVACLSKRLYIRIGSGGAGAAAGSNGTGGITTALGTESEITATTLIAQSGTSSSTGGTGSTGNAGGAGGGGQNLGSVADGRLGIHGSTSWLAGQTGTQGNSGSATAGSDVTWATTGLIIGSGAGGGSCSAGDVPTAGWGIIGSGVMPTIAGGAATGAKGNDGISLYNHNGILYASCGGAGGGGIATGTGGDGGNGGIGCGGGGGGAGSTGGRGGNGGPGMAILWAW